MATSAYASTRENTNSNRINRVLYGPCTDQLRDVLRYYVPPANFTYVISHNRPHLPRLTLPQKDMILPRNGHYSGDYSDMDTSLLYILLRNICNIKPHVNGWGNSPDVNDNSLAASIERIREARNKVGHSSCIILSQTDFMDIWSYIKDAVKSMDAFMNNGKKYEKEMDFLFTETMDPEQEEVYNEQLREKVEEHARTKETVMQLQESISDQQGKLQELQTQQRESERRHAYQNTTIEVHSAQIADLNQRVQGPLIIPDEKRSIIRLKDRLVEINNLEIPLPSLQEDSDKLPVEQLFASVIIKEECKETRKRKSLAQNEKEQERKEVKTPEDMLTKNGKPVRRVYMLGDAAHGKTTYCTWLLKKWCNAQKPGMSGRPLNEWENALNQFDFVFHLKFRHVDLSKANVTDMICQDILGEDTDLHTAAKHVLSSNTYRCLIIMDGLDEWRPDQSAIPQLKYKGMPNIDNMSNCVIFTTMRPWMFSFVARLVSDNDRVIEVQGLDDKGIENVIENVLVHYYEMKPDTVEYTAKYNEIISKLKNETLKSFIHIPLLAVFCIQIWCQGKQAGKSLTSFYSVMLDLIIERAKVNITSKPPGDKSITYRLPKILTEKDTITNHISILLKLGKVAYEGLLSSRENLEFQKGKLKKELGDEALQFALDVGLISQTEAPSITTRNVNVHFFHKSIQEFLAAIYIVAQKNASDSFCTCLCNVKVIMELSNVIMFICGMCPSLGSDISQRVVCVTDTDGTICRYRESVLLHDITVEKLYKLQISWYRELKYGQTDITVAETDSPVTQAESQMTFHVSDVFLRSDMSTEAVRVTREFLSNHHGNIRSLVLWWVPTDVITDKVSNDFLSKTEKTRSLVKLFINGGKRSVTTLCVPTLKILYLFNVDIQDIDTVHRPLMTDINGLQMLKMGNVSLGDRGLGLTPHMTDLQKVRLHNVTMTQSCWGMFVRSVIDIHHKFNVRLDDTDIDSDSMSTLHSSPHLTVTQDDVSDDVTNDDWLGNRFVGRRYGRYSSRHYGGYGGRRDGGYGGRCIKFTRVWPLTQTQ